MPAAIQLIVRTITLAILILVFSITVVNSVSGQQTLSESGSMNQTQLIAQQIYETNSIVADSDVKTLVMVIPDKAGANSSNWTRFLPSNATIVTGTSVLVLNADVNATHSVSMSGEGFNQSEITEVPYQNTTVFTLDEPGKYNLTDNFTKINATINVIDNDDQPIMDDAATNENRSAIGIFIAPTSAKSIFQDHLNSLGFNAVSTYDFESVVQNGSTNGVSNLSKNSQASNLNNTLFVWTQQVSNPNTLDGRLASKVRVLEEALYPGSAVKPLSSHP
jgi:plastocyanin